MTVKLYKDGDRMAIWTDADNERLFVDEFHHILSDMIEAGEHDNDWEFQLAYWLPQYVDICCSYRGYKNGVTHKTVLIAGSWYPDGVPCNEYTELPYKPPEK